MGRHTRVSGFVDPTDVEAAKQFYRDSKVQPFFYEEEPPHYARVICGLIASLKCRSVFEFGCNAGRNLNVLKTVLPEARLVGIDVNSLAISSGRSRFGLELMEGDEGHLRAIADNEFDVSFTVSVLDHVPFPEPVIRDLVRISRQYVLIYEIVHTEVGRVIEMEDTARQHVTGYPFSYFHDYPRYFQHAGAQLVLDVAMPAFAGNLGDFYHLQAYSTAPDSFGKQHIKQIAFLANEPHPGA